MISFIKTLKPFALTEHLLKSEALDFIFCSALRSLSTNNYLISHTFYKQKINTINTNKCHYSVEKTKGFGKVIDLTEDFSDLTSGVEGATVKPKTKKDGTKIGEKTREEGENKPKKNVDAGSHNYKSMDKNVLLLSSIMTKLRNKKSKEKHNQIVLNGKRLIEEAITAGLVPLKIFFSRATDLDNLNLPSGIKTYRIPYEAFKVWSDVVKPQGVLGIFKMPQVSTSRKKAPALPLTIICDNVRDPANLGSILRIIACVGCEKLLLTVGCTGIWEDKVLRAGAGAHFVFPVEANFEWTEIENLVGDNCRVFLADGRCQSESENKESEEETTMSDFTNLSQISQDLPITSYYSLEFEKKSTVIVIGGETEGLSHGAYEFAQKRKGTRVFIPMSNKMDSLNCSVALAVLAFEYKRQINCIEQKESHLSIAESGC